MYPVSDAFKEAIQSNTRRYFWSGEIRTKAGVSYPIDPQSIVKGSGQIRAQCCGSTEMELGGVYASELSLTLLSEIDRYSLKDAEISLTFHLELPDKSYEALPIGIFIVSEANRYAKSLEIKAYDRMIRFDKNFRDLEMIGAPYDFMLLASESCKVELAQSREDIEALPNGSAELSIYPENDIESYRDVLHFVAQVLGGFFVISRDGKLELRRFGNTPVAELPREQRYHSSFSDFKTRYTAISSTNVKTQIAEYIALDPDDGLTMNLGINPLLQFGLEATRRELLENILQGLSVIDYVPFDVETIGNPALDLGDVLRFTGGQSDAASISCLTAYTLKIGGKESLQGVGKNPLLSRAKSKNDKNLSGLLNQIRSGRLAMYRFTNAESYALSDVDTPILQMEFASAEETSAQFFAEVTVNVEADPVTRTAEASGTITVPIPQNAATPAEGSGSPETGTPADPAGETGSTDPAQTDPSQTDPPPIEVPVEVSLPVQWTEDGRAEAFVSYALNDERIKPHHPEESWSSGKHTLALFYPMETLIPNITNRFQVFLRLTGGTGSIAPGAMLAAITGQGMAAADAPWDGTIREEETIGRFSFASRFGLRGFTEDALLELLERMEETLEDQIPQVSVGGFGPLFTTEVSP